MIQHVCVFCVTQVTYHTTVTNHTTCQRMFSDAHVTYVTYQTTVPIHTTCMCLFWCAFTEYLGPVLLLK